MTLKNIFNNKTHVFGTQYAFLMTQYSGKFFTILEYMILLHQIFSPKASEPRHLQPSSTIVLEVACNKNHNGVE